MIRRSYPAYAGVNSKDIQVLLDVASGSRRYLATSGVTLLRGI